jgi:N-acetylmuramoyl-L-alanine amidase
MIGRRTIVVLLLAVTAASTMAAQSSLLQQSTKAFDSAQLADKTLNGKPESEWTRAEVIKVINAYQRVYLITPKTSYADDSLLAIARLYESINDTRNAVKTLKFLVSDYPQSPFRKSAERDIATLTTPNEAAPPTLDAAADSKDPVVPEIKESKAPKETKTVARSETRPGEKVTVDNVRYWPAEKSLRVVVDLSGDVRFKQGEARSPDRVYIDIANAHLNSSLVSKEWPVESGLLQKIRVGQFDTETVRVVLDVGTMKRATSFTLRDPDRLIIDVVGELDTVSPTPIETAPKNIITKANPVPVVPDPKGAITEAAAPPVDTAPKIASAKPSTTPPATTPKTATTEAVPTPPVDAPPKIASSAKANAAPVAPVPSSVVVTAPPVVLPTPAPPVASAAPPAPEAKPDNKPTDPGPKMASTAKPTSLGNRTLIRSLGLKVTRVVIDAGHGGRDTGSIGPTGYSEKDLVLDVAKRLKTLIETEIGAEVVMTRSDDTFVPLETRTAIANQQEADLFISIHANSSKSKSVRGVETFFLNFTNSREALDTASRENAGSEKSVHELQDLVKRIVLAEKMTESRELAQRVQAALSKAKGTGPDRGVKQAPFVVLIGANMPSILAEVSFISNPDEEKVLRTPAYRQRIAESLLDGVRSYADTLSGVKTASSIKRD